MKATGLVTWCVSVISLAFVVDSGSLYAAQSHPFLIVKESDYAELRSRASQSPWSGIKSRAVSDSKNLSYDQEDPSIRNKATQLHDMISSSALAFILDPTHKNTYLERLKIAFGLLDDLNASKVNAKDWNSVVPVGSAVFNAVLALDVVHDDFSSSECTEAEERIGKLVTFIKSSNAWQLNKYGVGGIWALYKGDMETFVSDKNAYHSRLMSLITSDGVFNQGPGYGQARLANDSYRDAKMNFIDVLDYTGNADYYSDTKLRKFYEWVFSVSCTPFRRSMTFGDTGPAHNYMPGSSVIGRATSLSQLAGEYAAWMNNGTLFPGRLLEYVLLRTALPPARTPVSVIYPDGGAWFWEKSTSTRALAGGIWNAKSSKDHSHRDVNAVHLAAYGEHVLRNSGYRGWEKGTLGFTWDYIHNESRAGNTVSIGEENHAKKTGAGISEGFVSGKLDYAYGASGSALADGTHGRSLVFIHPADGRNGYWVLFDEVSAGAGKTVNMYLHPNAESVTTVSSGKEYKAKAGPYLMSGHDVYLSMFYGTAPTSVSAKDGLLADWGSSTSGSFVGKYLQADFVTGSGGMKQMVTVLFPHDGTHAKADMARLSPPGATGASVNLSGGVVDYALESGGSSPVSHGGVSFKGKAALYRLAAGEITSYFVRKGTSFDDGAGSRTGFSAAAPISIYMRDGQGSVVSPGTEVTFYAPGITGAQVDGGTASLKENGAGWVKIDLGSGTHSVLLFTGTPPADSTPPTVVTAMTAGQTTITVTFSEPVNSSDAENVGNYVLDNSAQVLDAVVASDQRSVSLGTSVLTDGMEYTLDISGIRDLASTPNTMSGTASFTVRYSSCITSSSGWTGFPLEIPGTVFEVTFTATPLSSRCNGLITLSQGVAADYPDCAVLVRFNEQGVLDARDGSLYRASTVVPYEADLSYAFRLVVDVTTHRYSVFVRADGGIEETLADDFGFRSEQAGVAGLDHWNIIDDTGQFNVCGLESGPRTGIRGSSSRQVRNHADRGLSGRGKLFGLDGNPVSGLGAAGSGMYFLEKREGDSVTFTRILFTK